jgi:alpha-D-xyloside xylohydrolase
MNKQFTKTISLCILMLCVLVAPALDAGATPSIHNRIGNLDVTVTFYSPTIVRVTKTVVNGPKPAKSYSVIMAPQKGLKVSETKTNDGVALASSAIQVFFNTQNGQITFASAQGKTLLSDTHTSLEPRQDVANKGKYTVSQNFKLDSNEAIYGLGQLRDTCMNQRGRHIEIWNHNTYISIPYFTSEKGYGLYWDNPGKSYFDDNANGTYFTSEVGTAADYYFFYKDGTQDGVIACIRELTGQATMFPLWSMGFWQCRERYKTSDELAGVLDKYRELKIPVDAMVQDWQYWGCDSNWNAMRFMNPYYINKVGDPAWAKYLPTDMKKLKVQSQPRLKSPEEMVSYVHKNNAQLMITIWPDFGPWTDQYKKLKAINALLPFDTWPRNQGVLVYDPFNPKARDIYWHYLTNLYNMGMDAWWTDSTEPDHFEKPGDENYQTYDGSWLSVKNAFSIVHNKGIYEHQRAMKGNTKRSFQMTRSGAFGIQHYGTFSWSGDIIASWDEMKKQIPSGLNYTLCGIPMWNTDLGGFFYWEFEQKPTNPAIKELQTRWMEWGTFMPLMRNHCSSPMVSEIYEMGQKGDWAYDAIVDAIKLRYRLLPYIYSNLGDCVQNSGSMMRALVMDFAADERASRLNDEYMFGRNILVKPVTDPMYTWKDSKGKGHEIYPDIKKAAAPVSVYLPKGAKWYDFWDNSLYEGGQKVMKPCPINIIPVYVKVGTILPVGPDVQYSSEKKWDNLEIRIYPGADGSFTLYEDEGDNYNYEKGKFSEIKFSWDESSHKLTIGARKGDFKGMLKNRTFSIVLVEAGRTGISKPAKTIIYSGESTTVDL